MSVLFLKSKQARKSSQEERDMVGYWEPQVTVNSSSPCFIYSKVIA